MSRKPYTDTVNLTVAYLTLNMMDSNMKIVPIQAMEVLQFVNKIFNQEYNQSNGEDGLSFLNGVTNRYASEITL